MPKESVVQNLLSTHPNTTTYYLYHEGLKNHCVITPIHQAKPSKQARWEKYYQGSSIPTTPDSYFVHDPWISFHSPPRTLRRGDKHGPTVCLLNEHWLWKNWKLQFGEDMAKCLDPRGVVPWENRSDPKNRLDDSLALKGYKVRTWRMMGESGAPYHDWVNDMRQRGRQNEGDHRPVRAEEALMLKWASPLLKARTYKFEYGGIQFAWKGTGDLVQPERKYNLWLPLNHLKLVAEIPGAEGSGPTEVLLAQYTSSLSLFKYGTLTMFDSEIFKVLQQCQFGDSKPAEGNPGVPNGVDIRFTRLYDVIVATGVSMIMAEWEKRRVFVWIVIILLGVAEGVAEAFISP